MSGETISTAILTIASVICATSFAVAVYPSLLEAGAPIKSSVDTLNERVGTDVKIIHEAYDPLRSVVYIWVKNVGNKKVPSYMIGNNSDLFFGETGNFMRMPYNETGLVQGWNYTIENGNDNDWDRGETMRITINTSVTSGKKYFVQFISYNGITDSDYFTV